MHIIIPRFGLNCRNHGMFSCKYLQFKFKFETNIPVFATKINTKNYNILRSNLGLGNYPIKKLIILPSNQASGVCWKNKNNTDHKPSANAPIQFTPIFLCSMWHN